MVCEGCKYLVKQALDELAIPTITVKLGEIETKEYITTAEKNNLRLRLKIFGMEIIEKKNVILVEQIKLVIINYVYHSDERPRVSLSVYLSEKLKYNYGYLAHSFTELEGRSIEKYLAALKAERIKELIALEEVTLAQIADKLHYSSVAHLSKNFKKTTGITISHFKRLKDKNRLAIQEL